MALKVTGLLPEWLTEDYIANLLRKEEKTNLPIKILDVARASEQGDNYLGNIYRIKIECNTLQKSLIVKTTPSQNQGSKVISTFGVFQREHEVYHKTLPKVYSVMKEKLGKIEYLSPYCYPTTRTDTIILQDLKPLGYQMMDRKEQLDMDHALLVVTTLAKLHAISFIMDPESIKQFHDIFFSTENRHLSGDFLVSMFKSFCRTVSTWRGYEKYASALWRFSESAVDRFNDAVKPKDGTFCVLNHGDCWTNNILFRYCPTTGKLLDSKFIDFQLGRYASPVLDLMYFFYSSLRLDVWEQQDKLLRHYHNELIRWLSLAGCNANVYTFQDLQKDMKDNLAFALATVVSVSAIALADALNAPDLEKLFDENADTQTSQFYKAHNTEKYCKNVREFLRKFDKEGLICTESS